LKATNVRDVAISGFHANINLKKEPIICPKCKSPYWNIPKK
jgi:hypothetical protein